MPLPSSRAFASHLVALAWALLLAVSAEGQQLWLARNDNLSYGNYAAGWPASVIAFRFTAPSNAAIAAAEVFTGNQTPAPHSVEIRAHDAAADQPGVLLGQSGSWTSTHARCWQGAVLAQAAQVASGQDYWLVWRVGGWFPLYSRSADNHPGNAMVDTRVSDGSTWFARALLPAKFRLFTARAAGSFAPFGSGKPGQFGVPSIGTTGWPSVGSPFDVWLDGAARRQPALLLLGLPIQGGTQLPFMTLYSTASANVLVTTELSAGPSVGSSTWSIFVPNHPAASGFPLALQWVVLDPAAQDGISHSAAVLALIR
ncbi:MAG: hypothetical protein Fur0037_03310 [Planctomycetota bacterium]